MSLAGGTTFTKLDLSRAYLQLILDEESREYVTINTHKGLFRYTRLPFGVSVAPSVFQWTLESLLAGIPNVCIFLDDILVTGKTEAEHIENLGLVLQRLQNAGLKVNQQNCEFFRSSVTYLEHRIDRHGLHPMTEKVDLKHRWMKQFIKIYVNKKSIMFKLKFCNTRFLFLFWKLFC